jgi:pimeloyl-ACP methyl ester carboxylesterase
MSLSVSRFLATMPAVCLAFAFVVDSPVAHAATSMVRNDLSERPVFAFAPKPSTVDPMSVVYLHGITGRPEHGCPFFERGASELGWLVCPEGAVLHPNGTASWGGDLAAQTAVISHALEVAEKNGASKEPGVAIGFSQGGYVVVDLLRTHRARFRGIVLIAAHQQHPSAQMLREAGVERVALAAGAYDMAHDPLVLDAKRLEREGISTRFFDLGRVGHTYAAEDPNVLREAIAWAGGRP